MGGGQSLFSTEVILDECCVIIIERCWPSGGNQTKVCFPVYTVQSQAD